MFIINQAFTKKHLEKLQRWSKMFPRLLKRSKTYFPVGTTSFFTSTAAVDTQQMSKIE